MTDIKSPREILEEVFLSGDEEFDNENIYPRIDQTLESIDKFYKSKEKLERLDVHKLTNVIDKTFCEEYKKISQVLIGIKWNLIPIVAFKIARAICQKFGVQKGRVPSVFEIAHIIAGTDNKKVGAYTPQDLKKAQQIHNLCLEKGE